MESPQPSSHPALATGGGHLKSSNSSTKVVDDVTSLTTFNPFSEEDEHESSYTLVSSLFSRVKNSFAAPLSSAVAAASGTSTANGRESAPFVDQRRPSTVTHSVQSTSPVMKPAGDKLRPRIAGASGPSPAPPLVSVIPARPETPTFGSEYEKPMNRGGFLFSQSADTQEGGLFGTAIPGFPIQDDARSVHTTTSLKRSASASKVIRRIRGEGLSREYWMDDETCKECYDCKSVFTTWRRKHHCRICGQIFCSRCASNIIKGSRFGHEGMLRVCNLCLEKLNYDDDGDDDDRRSIISNLSSSWPHPVMDHYLQSLGHHSQSPFAASQLFARTDEPYSLYSIAETKRHLSGSDSGQFGSRPLTPGGDLENSFWEDSEEAQPAPFRRAMTDEDKDPLPDSEPFPPEQSPTAPRSATKTPDPQASPPFQIPGTKSSIQFPGSSPEHSSESPYASRSRVNSYAETEVHTPFLRSRVHSRLNELVMGEAGWRTRRESTAYAQELNSISMFHLRIMLRQMLTTEGISNIREWEETLLKLALRIARDLTFTAYPNREGDDMDVRRYVKIKKIPGGCPRDSEYVDGAVITKNVAHKQMPRAQKNPRIMLVTFPLEFQRVEGQYMHFAQIVRQEKEYLTNLVNRIKALRPHVVLAEKSVSRLALEQFLIQEKEDQKTTHIAVARTVKESAIKLVARMTQGDVISSIDKLALEPRLGHCGNFRVQTFDHPLIPCRRKSYMRFEGCSRDLGCTIILRGGDVEHLKRVKKVTLFLAFIVRNLKLETHLWKDSVITAPHLTTDAAPQPYLASKSTKSDMLHSTPSPRADLTHAVETVNDSGSREVDANPSYEELPIEDVKSLALSRRIQASLEPYLETFISVSATLRFPPPYPIWRMRELDDELQHARRTWEDEIIRSEEKPPIPKHMRDETITASSSDAITTTEDIKAQIEALPSPNLPESPSPDDKSPNASDASASTIPTDYFTRKLSSSASYASLRSPSAKTQQLLDSVEQVSLRDESCIAAQGAYDLVKWQHDEQRRVWEWYLRKNRDDFVVDKYQYITVMEFTLPIRELRHHSACFPPKLKRMAFYGKNDCTLGQFIERAIHDNLVQFLDPKAICSGKGCDEPLASHCTVFVHSERRLVVYVEHWDGQIKARLNTTPSPELITTWSACRICSSATPFIPVSEEMQRYSFAKFLELHFYPADVQLVQGAGCIHNIYQDHIRYFAMRGMTVTIQTDSIQLYELVYPPSRIHIRKETLFHLKNEDYETLLRKNAQWYSALVDDLKLINQDAATGDEETDAALTANIDRLIERAINERIEMAQLIQEVYGSTSPTDTLALNRVRAERQDRIVAWEADFDRLPKPKLSQLTEKDRKSSTMGTVRAMWPRRYDLPGVFENLQLPSASVSESASENEEAQAPESRTASESRTSSESAIDASEASNKTESQVTVGTDGTTGEEGTHSSAAEGGSDSDSTIAPVARDAVSGVSVVDLTDNNSKATSELEAEYGTPVSRLPRRSGQHPSVAELVKKYQDFIPASVSAELAAASFPALAQSSMESDQEAPPLRRQLRPRVKSKSKVLKRKDSVSDFEHGYAANVAPKYLAPGKTNGVQQNSRIPGPSRPVDSRDSSRRPSPDKRPSYHKQGSDQTLRGRASSPTPRPGLSGLPSRAPKSGIPGRNPKDRSQPNRIGSMSNVRNAFRKASNANFGGKVTNIARQFERMNKDIDRATRRYAVIRGRRARPVASSRATLEVFDSVKAAITDVSDISGESSSEADDEGDDEDDGLLARKKVGSKGKTSTAEIEQPEGGLNQASPIQEMQHDEHASSPVEAGKISPPRAPSPLPQVEAQPTEAVPSSPPLPGQQSRTPWETPSPSDIETGTSTLERPSTIMKALSGFWPPHLRGHMEFEADDPLADPEHIFRESSMVVRTDEPTSIIALALNSPQYRDMLAKSRAEKRLVKEPRISDGEEVFMPDDCSITDANSTWGVVNVDSGEDANPTEDLRVPSSKLPWAISFESGELTITCTILYPEQFDALRRTYDCEKSMIESLARCVKWNASGGKSGSAFLKTRDDRFIAKELSRSELETMATFGPAYFDYMSSAVTAGRPTLLARVFGCYKLVFRKKTANEKSSRSKSTQMNLLVMENLFYDKRFSKIFDLKGSTRNRHVHATGRENEVLLDENLVQTAHLTPFYVREHAKRLFRGALYNDTKFLSDINVMDYSLVVGVDSVKNELVVGIVDYIRTYTWDKKLESWVKESTFLAGGGKGEPTIITPKQYRQRFLSAMERYFPLIPDRWMKSSDNPEEECQGLQDFWPDW